MIDQKSLQLILEDYQALNSQIKKFHLKIAFSLVGLLLLITLFLGFGLFYNHPNVQTLVLSVGFILMVFILIAMLYTFKDYAPNQAKYSYLYPAIYDRLNHPNMLFKRHQDITNHLHIHRQSQLFSHGIRHQRIIATRTDDDKQLFLYDVEIDRFTHRGTIKQFQGAYYRLMVKTSTTFQIRTKGKPAKGDIDYRKINQIGPYLIYADKDFSLETQTKWVEKLDRFAQENALKELYLSVTPNEIALALSPTLIPAIKPPFTTLEIRAISDFFERERTIFDSFTSLLS